MRHLLIYITTIISTSSVVAQSDTLSITLSPFTKKEAYSEILYIAVFIKSNIRDSIEIDDSRSWINCNNTLGVKLVTQILQDDCYKGVVKSDCHPIYIPNKDFPNEDIESIKLGSFGEYTYIVKVLPVLRVEEAGLKRTLKNFTPFRFKLELPYKQGTNTGKAISKDWVYYTYPR